MKEGELMTKECENDQGATIREQSNATREQRTTREQRREGEESARGRPGSSPTREQRRRPGSRGPDQRPGSRGPDQGAEASARCRTTREEARGWRPGKRTTMDQRGRRSRGRRNARTTTTKWRRDDDDDEDGGKET
ncbi:hypothetical protein Syun_010415 [Stephania yunnanensis]|uniref:Uncharacterized protein n=1 Tax=Stephania yunnanensis TaxID=152371 RepID=A0AAP0KGE3_9MAGN